MGLNYRRNLIWLICHRIGVNLKDVRRAVVYEKHLELVANIHGPGSVTTILLCHWSCGQFKTVYQACTPKCTNLCTFLCPINMHMARDGIFPKSANGGISPLTSSHMQSCETNLSKATLKNTKIENAPPHFAWYKWFVSHSLHVRAVAPLDFVLSTWGQPHLLSVRTAWARDRVLSPVLALPCS